MDIEKRSDIELFIDRFYEKVKKDEVIGFIFNDIMKVDWEHHVPVICDFWERLILNTGHYNGNTMGVHFAINKKIALQEQHFKRWMELFTITIDENFEGPVAEMTKKKAGSIASLMQFKLNQENQNINIGS